MGKSHNYLKKLIFYTSRYYIFVYTSNISQKLIKGIAIESRMELTILFDNIGK